MKGKSKKGENYFKLKIMKMAIGGLLASNLISVFSEDAIPLVIAAESEDEWVNFKDGDRELLLLGLVVNDWFKIMAGYFYQKDDCLYFQNVVEPGEYNLTELADRYKVHTVYTEAKYVFPTASMGVTKEDIIKVINTVSIIEASIETTDFGTVRYETFASPYFESKDLHICRSGRIGSEYKDEYWFYPTISCTDEMYLEKESNAKETFTFGYFENQNLLPYYGDIYSQEPLGFTNKSGLIVAYFTYDNDGNKKSFRTQKDLDEFLLSYDGSIDDLHWRIAFHVGDDTNLASMISSNEVILPQEFTYFLDYNDLISGMTLVRKKENSLE